MVRAEKSLRLARQATSQFQVIEPVDSLLVFDFGDLPQNSVLRQTTAIEQLCILCGLGRRQSRRVSKATFAVLSGHRLEDVIENLVYLEKSTRNYFLVFQLAIRPLPIDAARQEPAIYSARRIGEKLDRFEVQETPIHGLEIRFAQKLGIDFVSPTSRELKSWRRVFNAGDWESAFGRISRLYLESRSRNRQLCDSERSSSEADISNRSQGSFGAEPPQFAAALSRLGGDETLLRMQMDFFTQSTPQLLQDVQKAIQNQDAKLLQHGAHRLKGLIHTFDAEFAGELAAQLEKMGRMNSLENAPATFALLESLVEELHHKILSY